MKRKLEYWQVTQRQGAPLEQKILMSKRRIRDWHAYWGGDVFVSFSGGLDSTVLLHLVRSIYPDVPAVFSNTGMEYPENVRFVRRFENVHTVRPDKRFPQVIKEYGYPVISKRTAQFLHEVRMAGDRQTATKRLRLTGIKSNGEYSKMAKIPDKWLYLVGAPFKISHRCCLWLKKRPLREAQKRHGMPYLGMRAEESSDRLGAYMQTGCNAYEIKHPHSTPLAFWLDKDVWAYIRAFNLDYSPLYDMGYDRSGCMFCCFGVHLEPYPNRFQKMQKTHPKWWHVCINRLGVGAVLDYIGVPYALTAEQGTFLDSHYVNCRIKEGFLAG